MDVTNTTVEVEGVKTRVLSAGEGDPPLVLVHGAEADASMWEPYIPRLAGGRRVLAPDLPGLGSDDLAPDMDCSPAGMARWFSSLLDAVGAERADLLGHSLGGSVAMHLALEVPGRVRRLVVVDASNLGRTEAFEEAAERLLMAVLGGGLDEDRARELLSELYGKEGDDPDVAAGAAYWTRPAVRTFLSSGGIEFPRHLRPWRLRELGTPTMLVWGERDRFFPLDRAREAVLWLPHSRLVVVKDGGHSPFESDPELFHLAVDAFLSD